MIIETAINEQTRLYEDMQRYKDLYITMQELSLLNATTSNALNVIIKGYEDKHGYKVKYTDSDMVESLKYVKHELESSSILWVRDSYEDYKTMRNCDLDLNNLFRACHDFIHVEHDLTFSATDEAEAVRILCSKLYDSRAVTYHAIDFYLQVLYYRDNKEFMHDQYNQTLDMLNNIKYAKELQQFIETI